MTDRKPSLPISEGEWIDHKGIRWKTAPGYTEYARWCRSMNNWCACRNADPKCHMERSAEARVALSMLSFEERLRWSADNGCATFSSLCHSPYRSGISGIIVEYQGRWFEKEGIWTATLCNPPGSKYASSFVELPDDVINAALPVAFPAQWRLSSIPKVSNQTQEENPNDRT